MSVYTLAHFENKRSLEASVIFVLGLFISTFGLFNHEFVEFESRFGLFAQEMLRNGISFFPTAYNQYYPDYPATHTILTYLFSLPFGKVTFLTALLPTAIASACTLVLTYLIGSLQSRVWGWYGVLLALLTYSFLTACRTIALDQFTTAVTAAGFYCCYSAHILQQPKRLAWLPLTWLIGFLFRGPIGFVIPASVAVSYFLVEKKWRAFITTGIGAATLLALCLMGLLAAAWYQGGEELLDAVISMQFTSRLHAVIPYPAYEYLINGFTNYLLAFPIACSVILNYANRFRQLKLASELNLLRHLTVWFLIILIGLSIPSAKKIRYLLPITPAIALIAGYIFIEMHPSKWMIYSRRMLNVFCTSLPYLGLVLLSGCWWIGMVKSQIFEVHYLLTAILLLGLAIIAMLYKKRIKAEDNQAFITIAIGSAAFILIYALIIQPIDTQFNRARPFVAQLEKNRQLEQQIVFYKIYSDGAAIKFMVALDKPIKPKFLSTTMELQNFTAPAVFIAEQQEFANFPLKLKKQFRVLYEGRLGHLPCIVFTRENGKN